MSENIVLSYPSIQERFLALLVNSIVAYSILIGVSGKWVPSGGLESIWFLSALSFWFLSLLSAPWFVPPRDAIITGVGAVLILATMDLTGVQSFASELDQIRAIAVAFSIGVVALSVYSLIMHDREKRSPTGHFAFRLASAFGTGEVLFTAPALISIIAFYQSSFAAIAWLLLYWILIVVARPVEKLFAAIRQYREERAQVEMHATVGSIVRVDHPNIVRVKLSSASAWKSNRLFTASLPDGTQRFVLSLFSQTQGSEVVGTGLCVGKVRDPVRLTTGEVCESHDAEQTQEFLASMSGAVDAKMVGFVVEKSSIGTIRFEVSGRSDLNEGDVVFARLNDNDIFYQIIEAETFEESFDQNPRGTHVVRAAQLGAYSQESGFTKYTWLPSMNTPLFAAQTREFAPPLIGDGEFEIGKVPSTNVGAIAKLEELIEYHSAVLGITGTGKTELALEVVREAVRNGVKVFCVDFTGEYRARLKDLDPTFPGPTAKEGTELEEMLFAVETGEWGAKNEKAALKKGIDNLRGSTEAQVDEFLRDEEHFLGIFELAEIANTGATLRLTELYLSTIMRWAQTNGRVRQVLIVLEEAHTIVPEIFGSGFDSNTKYVVSRIGQIALQGRKYGVGLMLISQRTALVSKTILSQCNTFFTHSLIDQTSLSFLESVYSAQHTRLIPNLGRYEFLAFGKAIKAERPIVLRKEFDPAKLEASRAVREPPAQDGAEEDAASEPLEETAAAKSAQAEPRIRPLHRETGE